MKQVVIGVAGHVDHGKTCLVRALTGMDTDRLAEEKARGLTIDLGFAWMELEGSIQAGVVDLPGHQKFLRNLLAGAGGADLALLVVAADEGVMPQTREHLEILSLLGVELGLVALTRTDLALPEERELALEEVAALTKGTFLERAPVVPVCAPTGEGVPEVRRELARIAQQVPPHPVGAPFYLPVDRAFTRAGFGPVATGTVSAGRLEPGMEVELLPGGRRARVRGLQSYGVPVPRVQAGQRAAVNLAGISLGELHRGTVLAQPGAYRESLLLDVRLRLLPNTPRRLTGGEQLHLFCGTEHQICRAALLGLRELAPGEEGYAQLRLSKPLAARAGTRFVVQWFSPASLAGGGVVLDPAPVRHRPSDRQALASLKALEAADPFRQLEAALEQAPFLPVEQLPSLLGLKAGEAQAMAQRLAQEGRADWFPCGILLSRWGRRGMEQSLERLLEGYHRGHPLLPGMPLAQVFACWEPELPLPVRQAVLREAVEAGRLHRAAERVALSCFAPRWDGRRLRIRRELLALYQENPLSPPALSALERAYAQERGPFSQVVEALLEEGVLVRGDGQLFFWEPAERAARQQLQKRFPAGESFTLAQCRDLLGTTRRYALALLEHWDREGLTQRQGEGRVFLS